MPRILMLASALVMVTPSLLPSVAQATAVDDQRREVGRIVDELDQLHTQADILAEDYAVAVDDKNQLDGEVAAAETRVAAKEAELNELRGDLSAVAVRAFTGSGNDVLGPLFTNAESYAEDLRRNQYSRVALSVGTGTTDDLDELIDDLTEERAELAAKREQVAALSEQIALKQQQTEELTAEYAEQRDAAEARLGQLIEEEEQRRADEAFARLQAEYAAEQAAASAAASSGGGGNGDGGNGGGGGGGGNADNGGGGGGSAPAAPAAPSAPKPAANVPSVSGMAGVAINAAQGQLGVPYKYATSNPGVSFDCSGLTHYAWGAAGVYLPRNSRAQSGSLPHVPAAAAQPGDLIFYYSPISHVGIYLGGGRLIHAPNSGTVVKIGNVNWNKVTVVARPG